MNVELKEKPVCCGELMHFEKQTEMLFGDKKACIYICLKCGHYLRVVEAYADDEELDNFMETYGLVRED